MSEPSTEHDHRNALYHHWRSNDEMFKNEDGALSAYNINVTTRERDTWKRSRSEQDIASKEETPTP